MTYEYNGVGLRACYELGAEAVTLRTKETFGSRSEQIVRFDALRRQPSRVWVRDTQLMNRVIGVVVALLVMPIVLLLSETDFGLWRYAKPVMIIWFVVGIAVCIGTSVFVRRVQWAVFNYRSGPAAFAVGCGRSQQAEFEAFVAEIQSRVPAA